MTALLIALAVLLIFALAVFIGRAIAYGSGNEREVLGAEHATWQARQAALARMHGEGSR